MMPTELIQCNLTFIWTSQNLEKNKRHLDASDKPLFVNMLSLGNSIGMLNEIRRQIIIKFVHPFVHVYNETAFNSLGEMWFILYVACAEMTLEKQMNASRCFYDKITRWPKEQLKGILRFVHWISRRHLFGYLSTQRICNDFDHSIFITDNLMTK